MNLNGARVRHDDVRRKRAKAIYSPATIEDKEEKSNLIDFTVNYVEYKIRGFVRTRTIAVCTYNNINIHMYFVANNVFCF